MTKGLKALSKSSFMTEKLMNFANLIIHGVKNKYRCTETYSKFSTTEALINMPPCTYPQMNKFIRFSRGYPDIPDFFGEPESFSYNISNFNYLIEKYSAQIEFERSRIIKK